MTQRAYPLDDTLYSASDVRLFHVARYPGIFNATGTDLQVSAAGGLSVSVLPGYAFLKTGTTDVGGITFGSTEAETFTIDVPGSAKRYDYIAVRYTKSTNQAELVYVKGTSAKPTGPARDSGSYEIIIAIIEVPANASQITAQNIVDTRLDSKYCGLVVDGTERVPIEGLIDQFNAFMDTIKDTLDGNVAGNLLNKINEAESSISNNEAAIQENTASLGSLQDSYNSLQESHNKLKADYDAYKADAKGIGEWTMVARCTTSKGYTEHSVANMETKYVELLIVARSSSGRVIGGTTLPMQIYIATATTTSSYHIAGFGTNYGGIHRLSTNRFRVYNYTGSVEIYAR